ncbi:PHD-finger domain containing protein [Nitzschia inconspicua]|uniref:PHD-finger domain containing protein n=1 Tax=Nitzschia inconspicua TaxID=303405 RepID=A0A9K3KRL2_9STRA|nr:PHD-finger domain containing protein [Nitzschia inconspicua]
MVVKKYLCAAPRPESYEEKAEALLDALGGDEEKRESVVRQTLAQLRKLHGNDKRTGPGRRSNADHAIAFYEYILGEDEEDGNDEDQNCETDEESDAAKSADSTRDNRENTVKEEDEGHGDDSTNGDESTSNDTNSKTVESMDTQEFLNQHNDECEVCNQPGELLCCSTCSLVFHMKCLRPTLASLPKAEDEWSCPHCIIQGIKGHKRHSKAWKAAAAGVRAMNRLQIRQEKEGKEDEQNTGDEDNHPESPESDDNKKPSAVEKEVITSESKHKEGSKEEKTEQNKVTAKHTEEEEDEANKAKSSTENQEGNLTCETSEIESSPSKKRSLAPNKTSDPSIGTNESTENLVVRGRRIRRQPALFQPQACADSRWQSDERVFEASKVDEDKEKEPKLDVGMKAADIPDAAVSTSTRTVEAKSSPAKPERADNASEELEKSGVYCNFCFDDPVLSVCVFCGCRKCFGKHSKEKYVKCRKCNDEYHLFCVGLEKVPEDKKKWVCFTCDKTTSQKISTRRATTSVFGKGRPYHNNKSDTSVESSNRTSTSKHLKTTTSSASTSPEKTPRGRSPTSKNPLKTPSPRKRGRPPKSTRSSEPRSLKKRGRPPKSISKSPAPSKRDRPPKDSDDKRPNSDASTGSSSPPRKRGRPPKNPSSPSSEVKKRGPGRPPNSSRGPGRPPKSDISVASSGAASSTPAAEDPPTLPEPIKLSRSGRIVKRQSFHDEVVEGEQHLRSTKVEQEQQQSSSKSQPLIVPKSKSNESSEQRKNLKVDKIQELEKNSAVQEVDVIAPSLSVDGSLRDEEDKDEVFAPVRMKPILQPPAPSMRPIIVESKPFPAQPVIKAKVVKPTIVPPVVAPAGSFPSSAIRPNIAVPMATGPQLSRPAQQPAVNPTPITVKPAPAAPESVAKVSTAWQGRSTSGARSSAPSAPRTKLLDPKKLEAAITALPSDPEEMKPSSTKTPRRKPGARECMQISRRFGVKVIPEKHMKILLDYCSRGKVEHLIRMRERLDCHSRYLESQIAGLEMLVIEKGETDVVVPPLPECFDSIGKYEGLKQRTFSDAGSIDTVVPQVHISGKPTAVTVSATKVNSGVASREGIAPSASCPSLSQKPTAAACSTTLRAVVASGVSPSTTVQPLQHSTQNPNNVDASKTNQQGNVSL